MKTKLIIFLMLIGITRFSYAENNQMISIQKMTAIQKVVPIQIDPARIKLLTESIKLNEELIKSQQIMSYPGQLANNQKKDEKVTDLEKENATLKNLISTQEKQIDTYKQLTQSLNDELVRLEKQVEELKSPASSVKK